MDQEQRGRIPSLSFLSGTPLLGILYYYKEHLVMNRMLKTIVAVKDNNFQAFCVVWSDN